MAEVKIALAASSTRAPVFRQLVHGCRQLELLLLLHSRLPPFLQAVFRGGEEGDCLKGHPEI